MDLTFIWGKECTGINLALSLYFPLMLWSDGGTFWTSGFLRLWCSNFMPNGSSLRFLSPLCCPHKVYLKKQSLQLHEIVKMSWLSVAFSCLGKYRCLPNKLYTNGRAAVGESSLHICPIWFEFQINALKRSLLQQLFKRRRFGPLGSKAGSGSSWSIFQDSLTHLSFYQNVWNHINLPSYWLNIILCSKEFTTAFVRSVNLSVGL